MKQTFLALFLSLFIFQTAMAQQTEEIKANPADVGSIDAIMKAVYDVISGDKETKRDWNRFRSLFHKDARLIPTGKNQQTGVTGANAMTPDDYAKRAEPFFAQDGFYEREIARKVEIYGNIAHVFSTYETFRQLSEKKPFMRGINSFQLLNDGRRWWVMTIYWQAETSDNPIPEKYLKSDQVEYLGSETLKGYPFSESVRAGKIIYLSGQIGTDASGKLVGGGIAAETAQTLENIKAALKRYDASLDDVVKCTVMIADMKEWPEMNKVYVTYFKNNLPARSSLGANGLALNARVEIECIAAIK